MENTSFEPVRPVSPLAGYVGGKRVLAKQLVPMIAGIPHAAYCEPFVGMGGVFFRRMSRPKAEAINDRSRDVATFFRVLQRHYQAFLDMLKWQVASRAEFERLTATDPVTLTDLERAARFLFLQRMSFGGKVNGRTFGVGYREPASIDITRLVPLLEAAHERLGGVYIECLPWQDFIVRWDRPDTLFFLDPPYWGVEHYYGRGQFERAEFEQLSEQLAQLKGPFIMTLNDVPDVRRLFKWAKVQPVRLSYSTGKNRTEGREVIITRRLK